MNLQYPFQAPALVPVASTVEDDNLDQEILPPECGWLLPLPKDAPPNTKRETCGEEAHFSVRVKDAVADVVVDVCAKHKAEHNEKAASLRHQQGKRPRHKAS